MLNLSKHEDDASLFGLHVIASEAKQSSCKLGRLLDRLGTRCLAMTPESDAL